MGINMASLLSVVPVSKTEAGWSYDGPLSIYAEWHSLAAGVGAGVHYSLTGELWAIQAVVAIAFGLGVERGRGRGPVGDMVPHLRDVGKEPAYALAGVAIGVLLMLVPSALGVDLAASGGLSGGV